MSSSSWLVAALCFTLLPQLLLAATCGDGTGPSGCTCSAATQRCTKTVTDDSMCVGTSSFTCTYKCTGTNAAAPCTCAGAVAAGTVCATNGNSVCDGSGSCKAKCTSAGGCSFCTGIPAGISCLTTDASYVCSGSSTPSCQAKCTAQQISGATCNFCGAAGATAVPAGTVCSTDGAYVCNANLQCVQKCTGSNAPACSCLGVAAGTVCDTDYVCLAGTCTAFKYQKLRTKDFYVTGQAVQQTVENTEQIRLVDDATNQQGYVWFNGFFDISAGVCVRFQWAWEHNTAGPEADCTCVGLQNAGRNFKGEDGYKCGFSSATGTKVGVCLNLRDFNDVHTGLRFINEPAGTLADWTSPDHVKDRTYDKYHADTNLGSNFFAEMTWKYYQWCWSPLDETVTVRQATTLDDLGQSVCNGVANSCKMLTTRVLTSTDAFVSSKIVDRFAPVGGLQNLFVGFTASTGSSTAAQYIRNVYIKAASGESLASLTDDGGK